MTSQMCWAPPALGRRPTGECSSLGGLAKVHGALQLTWKWTSPPIWKGKSSCQRPCHHTMWVRNCVEFLGLVSPCLLLDETSMPGRAQCAQDRPPPCLPFDRDPAWSSTAGHPTGRCASQSHAGHVPFVSKSCLAMPKNHPFALRVWCLKKVPKCNA